MLRGLQGRRVAIVALSETPGGDSAAHPVIQALEQAGAQLQALGVTAPDEDFQGSRYAALVLSGDGGSRFSDDKRVVQLVREFLASDKPVAAFGSALSAILAAGGATGRSIATHHPLGAELQGAGSTCVDEAICVDEALITAGGHAPVAEFAARVVQELSERLEERAVDEMSDLSFPASDPPAVTPATVGPAAADHRT